MLKTYNLVIVCYSLAIFPWSSFSPSLRLFFQILWNSCCQCSWTWSSADGCGVTWCSDSHRLAVQVITWVMCPCHELELLEMQIHHLGQSTKNHGYDLDMNMYWDQLKCWQRFDVTCLANKTCYQCLSQSSERAAMVLRDDLWSRRSSRKIILAHTGWWHIIMPFMHRHATVPECDGKWNPNINIDPPLSTNSGSLSSTKKSLIEEQIFHDISWIFMIFLSQGFSSSSM